MKSSKLTEREAARIVKEKSLVYEPNPKGLGYEFYYSMRQNKSAIAQIDAESGEVDSYGNLMLRCIRTALRLIIRGISGNDIICLCSSNHLNSCVPIIATLFLGIRIAPLDPSQSLQDISYILALIQPKLIFVSSDAVDLLEEALDIADVFSRLVVFGRSDKHIEFDEFLEPFDNSKINEYRFRPLPIFNIKETAIILFSGGNRGIPKGICLTHRNLMIQLVNVILNLKVGKRIYLSTYTYERTDEGLGMLMSFRTYFWISAIMNLCASIITGSTRLICTKFEPAAVWNFIDKYEVPCTICSTNEAVQLYRAGKPEGVDGKSLKLLLTMSRSLSKMDLMELRKLVPFCFITNMYGQTEACGPVIMYTMGVPRDIRDQYENPTSCGRLIPGITCKIVDPYSGKILGPLQAGELRYKAEFLITEYYNIEASSDFDNDGWFKTGDIAYYDYNLCFHVFDPLLDVFKYKTWHIVPTIIENIIREHIAVKDAVVIGIPHEDARLGEIPMGLVTLKKGMRNRVTEDCIKEFVNKLVSNKLKLRGGVKIVKEIPLTLSGRPKRQQLKRTVLEE